MKSRDLLRLPRSRRAFSLAAELRVLAVGLFAVAAGALLLDRSVPVGSADVALAAAVVVAMFVLNVAVGVAGVRRAARAAAVTAAGSTAVTSAAAGPAPVPAPADAAER